jgi:hypothetical protein
MAQYFLKKGLQKFKEEGDSSVSNELMQLHIKDTSAPHDASKLSQEQKT